MRPLTSETKQGEQEMPWSERRLTPRFGVELTGARIDPALSASARRDVYDAVMKHGLALIPGQDLADDNVHDFAASLGPVLPSTPFSDLPQGKLLSITNLDAEGRLRPPGDWYVRAMKANELWHVDLSFLRPRATLSILYGKVVTEAGGNTEFCDMRLACEALSTDERAHLATLTAYHSIFHSRRSYGFDELNEEELGKHPPVPRPLLSRHEESGRDTLLLASHICELSGYGPERSAALMRELTERATVPENCYSHKWRAGDLLLWDNRCVMHRATPFDAADPRDLRAVRLCDLADVPQDPALAQAGAMPAR
jgi:alpha-ketoglutarate-dependent 2,4-dichlorophenoxyacetate dioxygenase